MKTEPRNWVVFHPIKNPLKQPLRSLFFQKAHVSKWWSWDSFTHQSGQIIIVHLKLDFPEIAGDFPSQTLPFEGPKLVFEVPII